MGAFGFFGQPREEAEQAEYEHDTTLRRHPHQRGKCRKCNQFFGPPTLQCPTCAAPLDFPYVKGNAL